MERHRRLHGDGCMAGKMKVLMAAAAGLHHVGCHHVGCHHVGCLHLGRYHYQFADVVWFARMLAFCSICLGKSLPYSHAFFTSLVNNLIDTVSEQYDCGVVSLRVSSSWLVHSVVYIESCEDSLFRIVYTCAIGIQMGNVC